MLAPDALRALLEEYLGALSFAPELHGQEASPNEVEVPELSR